MTTKQVAKLSLIEFLIHGVKYAFPAQIGGQTRGVPTGYAAPPLSEHMSATQSVPPVWPSPTGKVRGYEFEPLYRGAVFAAEKDSKFYQLLALVDAMRDGRSRESKLAEGLIKEMLEVSDQS